MVNDDILTTNLAALQQHITAHRPASESIESDETLQTLVETIRDQTSMLLASHTALRQEQRDYQQLFEWAPDGYLLTDMRGIIQRANHAAADLLHTAPNYLPGKPLRVYIVEPDLRLFLNLLKQLQKGLGQPIAQQLSLQPSQGDPLPIFVRVGVVPNAEGAPTALHWLLHHIATRTTVDLLRQSNDELEYRVRERTDKLFQINRTLQDEIAERQRVEAALRKAQQELENRVEGRTTELNTVVQALLNEVTEHQGTEAALRESQTLLQAILDNSPAAIFVRDIQGTFLLVNRYFAAMHQCDSDTMVGSNLSEFYSPEEVRDWREQDERVIATGKPLVYEQTNIVNGDSHTYLAVKFGIYDVQNTIASIGVIAQDITDRKYAEETKRHDHEHLERLNKKLQRNRDVLYTLIDGVKDGLLLLDDHGTILETNQALADLLGRDVKLLLNQRWEDLSHQQNPPFPLEKAMLTLLDREPRVYRAFYTTPDGEEHILDIRSFPITETQEPNGLPDLPSYSMIIHIADVTERFQLEAMMIQNERLASTGRLAAAIAHEINTPLQTIQTSLYMFDKVSEDERQSYLTLAQEEMGRIKTTLGQFLEIHRASDDAYAQVDFNALVQRMVLLTSGTAARQNIQVISDLHPHLPMIRGQTNELNQVILNLMMNAIEAMPQGGRLLLKTYVDVRESGDQSDQSNQSDQSRHHVIFDIADTGTGIRPRDLDHIFNPFYTTKKDGTGLGLSISQRIMARHGGRIMVQNNEGPGSTFTMTLPLEGK